MAELNFNGKFRVIKETEAPMVLHEKVASGELDETDFSVHRSATGLDQWIKLGGIRIYIPMGQLIEDAVKLAAELSAEGWADAP